MNAAPPLELLAATHLVPLATVLAIALAVPLWARGLPADRVNRIARSLAATLVTYRTAYVAYQLWGQGLSWRESLPLHLCGLLFYVSAYMLWSRSYRTYEIAYFWTLGGTLQALLTPDVPYAFPSGVYIDTMASHGALVLAVLFATFAFRFRPRLESLARALGATVLYASVLYPLNLALDANYMYLRHKPEQATLLDFLGPWPWYLLSGLGVAAASYVFWYLPFALDRRKLSES